MQISVTLDDSWKKKLADDQCSSITKGSIYHIKLYVHKPFNHGNGLTLKLDVKWKYLLVLCLIFAQAAFLLRTAE